MVNGDGILTEDKKAFHIKNEDILQTECYEGAIHVDNRKFPLVVFSHGYNSYVEANTFLCCELASNGYVVASIGHAYEAAINEFDDGTYDLYDIKNNRRICNNFIRHFISQVKLLKSKGTPEELYKKFDAFQRENAKFLMERIHEWGKDVMCVIDTLKTKYVVWIDFSKGIGASGHSFGGATAYYLCQHSEEITCGINIDGGIFGDYEGMVMKKPFLQILGESYNTATKPLLDTEAPVKCEIFHDIKHSGFTDAKFFIQYKMIVGKMDACEMHRKLLSCHLQFFQKYIA